MITADGIDYTASSRATLARSDTATTHDDITILDPGYEGVDLRRRIVFSKGLGWLLVDDRASSNLPAAVASVARSGSRARRSGGPNAF